MSDITEEKEGGDSGNGNGNGSPEKETALATREESAIELPPGRAEFLSTLTKLIEAAADDDAAQQNLERLYRTIDPDDSMLEEMAAEWVPPVLRIVQNMTRAKPDGSVVGDFYTTDGAVFKPPIKGTPVLIYPMHRMFPTGNVMGAPVCMAPDAKNGNTFGACVSCVNLPMGATRNGQKVTQKTDCDRVICVIMLTENLRVMCFEFSGGSAFVGLKIMSLLRNTWDNPHDFWLSIGSKEINNAAGNNYHAFTNSDTRVETPDYVRKAAAALHKALKTERAQFLKTYKASLAQAQVDERTMEQGDPQTSKGDNPDLTGKF